MTSQDTTQATSQATTRATTRATSQGTGTFAATSWEEAGLDDAATGPRTSHAHTTNTFDGAIEGTSSADHVMFYSGQGDGWGTGTYHGYEQITGSVGGRTGSFVLHHVGGFGGTNVTGRWSVIEGSGTGELVGLRGEGGFSSDHGDKATAYTFDYEFAARA